MQGVTNVEEFAAMDIPVQSAHVAGWDRLTNDGHDPIVVAQLATQPSGHVIRLTKAHWQFKNPYIIVNDELLRARAAMLEMGVDYTGFIGGGALALGLLAGVLIGRKLK